MATSCAPHTGWSCDTGHAAVLVRWYWQTTDVMAPRGWANVVEVPRRLPAGLMPFVGLGAVGQRMALSLQP
jgi:hypothetical protein